MEENSPSSPSYFARLKAKLTEPRTLYIIAAALAAGAAGSAVGRHIYLKPIRAVAAVRYQSHQGLMRLYDLQLAYHAQHGTYADGLDTLLASTPDGTQLREKLKAVVDLETLAVIGDEDRFRLEANVLDPQRTSVKIRGPLDER
ncbi:MAG: hypothetical protein Q8T11_13975 [Elusimicrobiota bacterium]|nr:hypothetical protein [Elusimicrobiota bacterium]